MIGKSLEISKNIHFSGNGYRIICGDSTDVFQFSGYIDRKGSLVLDLQFKIEKESFARFTSRRDALRLIKSKFIVKKEYGYFETELWKIIGLK